MNTVYVLRSIKNGKLYVGSTGRSLAIRVTEHNLNGLKWTSGNGPFRLVHYEIYDSAEIAHKREQFFKTGKGRIVLSNILRTKTQNFTQL